ncbi:unnamed protein product [Pleuronectes platessa]|uniref:Rho guanine nucleotide exchange factor (GEF) 40 n=1 Tax=Pleuronectes platessa TaxID=8262 RepID=A0A9N7YC17_PLEPL|nr:unnamed protein product [Pleuronectes platessa]
MGSEAMEDCVQGALSSLYPPFESTAPPLLSQVFSVLESTYQHDSLRYLLDYFVPAKHLLHKLQQHACSQYLGCLFLHSGWPLCLGEKVVVQLSTLDWRLLRSNDFYLQVVPFSTRCPRLALKCLAPGGRTVQEILVPESQHPLVFTSEWLHSINKERGHKREVGGGLDTCLVSTCDGVVRIPWKEVVYPKFIHDPSEELALMSNYDGSISGRLPSEGGSSSLGGWGGSSSGELDSWSWDEEEDLQPDGLDSGSALPRRRRSEDGLGRTARPPQLDGDYVELLEPRGGPDGGVDPRQRYLEMHGISKTKTLPLCRRSKAIKLRNGRAWGYGRVERSGSLRAVLGARGDVASPRGDSLAPPPGSAEPCRGRRSYSSSVLDSDEGDKSNRDSGGVGSSQLFFDGPSKERRPGVGKERESIGLVQPGRDELRSKDSESRDCLVTNEILTSTNHQVEHVVEGHSDPGSHSDSVFEDTDKPLSGDSDATTPTSDAPERPFTGVPGSGDITNSGSTTTSSSKPKVAEEQEGGKTEDRMCPRGKEVKTAGFRAPRRKRKGKGAKGRARSAGRAHHKVSKLPGKAPPSGPTCSSTSTKLPVTEENQSGQTEPADEPDAVPTATKEAAENSKTSGAETEAESLSVCNGQSGTSLLNHSDEEPQAAETCPGQLNGVLFKEPPLLRELNTELLHSGKLNSQSIVGNAVPGSCCIHAVLFLSASPLNANSGATGTVDRLGRALVVSETDASSEGSCEDETVRVLACYHSITRPEAKDKGLTVLIDSRRSPPSARCLSALHKFQLLVPGGLGSVLVLLEEQQEAVALHVDGAELDALALICRDPPRSSSLLLAPPRTEAWEHSSGHVIHMVQGTGVLQQFVDKQQLLTEMDGDFVHCHSDWLAFRLSLESLTERCESALMLLGEALQSMDTEPLPDNIKAVPLSIDKHRQLMASVLADQRLTELQQRGGAWLAGLTNSTSGLAQKSPDCR